MRGGRAYGSVRSRKHTFTEASDRGGALMDTDEHGVCDRDSRSLTSVREWRMEKLILAGFTVCEAEALSTNDDWRDAIPLVEGGCPSDVACRIVGADVKERDPNELLARIAAYSGG